MWLFSKELHSPVCTVHKSPATQYITPRELVVTHLIALSPSKFLFYVLHCFHLRTELPWKYPQQIRNTILFRNSDFKQVKLLFFFIIVFSPYNKGKVSTVLEYNKNYFQHVMLVFKSTWLKIGSHQNLREIVILEQWKQVPEILERWKQIPEILENVKTISRNLREIEFVEKRNQVSEIAEKVT